MLNPLEYNAPALTGLLQADLLEKLHALGTSVTYQDGQLIHSRGDKKPGVSIVQKGGARIGTIGVDGSFLTISVLGPGQTFGEHTVFTDLPRTHDVSAVGDTVIDQISGTAFLALFEAEPSLARALLVTALTRSHALIERLDDMRRLSLPVKTAKYLISVSMVSDPADIIVCTQSNLAIAVGVSRISLGKALKKLEALKLIKPGYGQITLTDIPRMEDWIDSQRQTEALSLSYTN